MWITDLHDYALKTRSDFLERKKERNKKDYSKTTVDDSDDPEDSISNKWKNMPKAYKSSIEFTDSDDINQWTIADTLDLYQEQLEDSFTQLDISSANTTFKINNQVMNLKEMEKSAGIVDDDMLDISSINNQEMTLDQYRKYKKLQEGEVTGCQYAANVLNNIGNYISSWFITPKINDEDYDEDVFDYTTFNDEKL